MPYSWKISSFHKTTKIIFVYIDFYNLKDIGSLAFIYAIGGRRGHDRMVVGFTTSDSISAYHHDRCELESRSWRGVPDTTLCHKFCQ